MGYAHKITKATLVILVFSLATAILGYFTKIYLAHNLSIENFGLFYSIISFTSLLLLFKDFGFGPALAKYIPEFRHKKEFGKLKSSILTSYIFQIFIGVFFFLLIWISAPYLVSDFFRSEGATPVLILMMLEVLVASTTIKYALQGLQFIKAYALMELVRVALVLGSILILLSHGVVGIAAGYVASSIIVQIIFSLYIIRKTHGMPERTRLSQEDLLYLSKFGFYFLFSSIAGFLIAYTDTLTLTALKTLTEVGIYQVAISTSQILWGIALALSVVLMPVISEMWAKNEKEKVSRGIGFLLKFVMIILIPAMILMVSFSEIVINILFGMRYLGASTSLQMLAFGAVFYSLMAIYSTALASIGRPDITTKITIFIGVFNLAANLVLIYMIGIFGAALATTISYFLGFYIYNRYFNHAINIKMTRSDILKIIAGGLLSLLVVYIVKELLFIDVFIESIITIAIAVFFYSVFIIKTGVIERGDVDILRASRIPLPAWLLRILENNSR